MSRQVPRPFALRWARCLLVPISCCHCRAKWSSSADKAMLASNGESTPPTQWVTRRMVTLRIRFGVVATGAGAAGAGWDAVPDGDLLRADEDVFDQQPQYPLAFFNVSGGGRAAQLGEEAPEVVGELEVGVAVGCLGVEGIDLGAEVCLACAQVRHPGTQLVDGQQLLGERLDHGGDRAGGLGRLEFEAVPLPGDRVGGAGGLQPLLSSSPSSR